jgi:tetratricopeptide (TPR) repeat protein
MTVLTLALILHASVAAGEPSAAAAGAAPASTASPTPTPSAGPPPVTAIPPAIPLAPAPTAAVAEKLAQGDRALAAGDLRGALFAYLDAVYAQPAWIASRVKLGRAYLALRYPALAIAQAEKVLAAIPGDADATRLIEDARKPPAPAAVATPAPAASARAQAPSPPHVYRLPADAASEPVVERERPSRTPAALEQPTSASSASATARQEYLLALQLIGRRDYSGAIAALDDVIAIDPRLAVAYAARASARFGLRRYREAADDYKASLGLDASLATPVYGLAECYRLLGDPAAGQMYERYAASRAGDVREDLREIAAQRARELSRR